MVGVAEGAGEGVIVGITVTFPGEVGDAGAGAQLPTKKVNMKNAMKCFGMMSLSFRQSHYFYIRL
jgi:hypothetical protein